MPSGLNVFGPVESRVKKQIRPTVVNVKQTSNCLRKINSEVSASVSGSLEP